MSKPFQHIALLGKPRQAKAMKTHQELFTWLTEQGYQVMFDQELKADLTKLAQSAAKQDPQFAQALFVDVDTIGKTADLAIVVGGDGNMLHAARVLSGFDIAVIGVNRGRLGFLTDLDPNDFKQALSQVLQGHYISEKRFLLDASVYRDGELVHINRAFNEVVLHPGKVAHMIKFEVYIDGGFAFSQLSDGLIISTPTGSTAYSLSGGGPILSPSLNAISLVPMFPHTLSSRPLVIDGDRKICLRLDSSNRGKQSLSCDGQTPLSVSSKDEIHIHRASDTLNLIHPETYQYYHVLRNKLGWSTNLI